MRLREGYSGYNCFLSILLSRLSFFKLLQQGHYHLEAPEKNVKYFLGVLVHTPTHSFTPSWLSAAILSVFALVMCFSKSLLKSCNDKKL